MEGCACRAGSVCVSYFLCFSLLGTLKISRTRWPSSLASRSVGPVTLRAFERWFDRGETRRRWRIVAWNVLQTRWTDGPEGGAVLMLALLPVLALQGKASSGAAATYGLDQHGGCGHFGGSFVVRRVQYMAATCSVHRQR